MIFVDWILLMVDNAGHDVSLLSAFSVRHSCSYWFRDIIPIVMTLTHDILTIFYLTNNPSFILRSYHESPAKDHLQQQQAVTQSSQYYFQSIKRSPSPIQQQISLFKHENILQHYFRSLFGTDCQRFCGTN